MNVLRTILCKNEEQYTLFPEIFRSYFEKRKEIEEKRKKNEKKVENLKKKIENAKREQEEEEKERQEKKEGKGKGEEEEEDLFEKCSGRKQFLSKTEKKKKTLEPFLKNFQKTKEMKEFSGHLFFKSSFEKPSSAILSMLIPKINQEIKKSAFMAAVSGEKDMISIFKKATEMMAELEKGEKAKEKGEEGKEKEKEIEELQKKLEAALMDLEDQEQITKLDTVAHREEFMGGRSVKSYGAGEINLDEDLSMISDSEMENILHYIQKNSQKFKTKISRNIRSDQRLKFDMKNIIKKACSTDGIPLRLKFKRPLESKPKLVLFLDISGSCSSASKLMLLFMYCLKQAFAGGCEAYVFVNSFHNVTNFMKARNPMGAIKAVFASVPTKGVYSDYYRPLKQFYEKNMSTINKNSIIVFIGDARNNRNASGEEFMREISRKARCCFWLNTEPKEEWDTGDSIMSCYKEYMQSVTPVLTVGDLIRFITEFKIKGKR